MHRYLTSDQLVGASGTSTIIMVGCNQVAYSPHIDIPLSLPLPLEYEYRYVAADGLHCSGLASTS